MASYFGSDGFEFPVHFLTKKVEGSADGFGAPEVVIELAEVRGQAGDFFGDVAAIGKEADFLEDAIVFEGVDFFMIWLFLMLKRYDWMADRFVDLREEPRSREEIIALLTSRVAPIR